jgi:LysM repeat protein
MSKAIMVAASVVVIGLLLYFGAVRTFSRRSASDGASQDRSSLVVPSRADTAPAEVGAAASPTPVPVQTTPSAPIVAPPAPAPVNVTAELDRAQALVNDNNFYEARTILTTLILVASEGPEREKTHALLDEANSHLFFSPEPSPDCAIYKVGKGDSLWTIMQKTHVSVALIKQINRRPSDAIREGESLKIPQGWFSILVDCEHFRLMVFFNGQYIKEYPVGIGKSGLTPSGEFEIEQLVVDPQWTDPQGKVHAARAPDNQLGSRWMGFKATATRNGLGIHGTIEPASIGTVCSNGCVRMHNQDAEEVYSMMRKGDKVMIR